LDEVVFTGKIKKYVYEAWIDKATFPPETAVQILDLETRYCIRALVKIVVQEELLCSYPRDWWQAVKQRWFPGWLLKRYPVQTEDVWAVHKFPDLAVPPTLGREIIHLEVKNAERSTDSHRSEDALEDAGFRGG